MLSDIVLYWRGFREEENIRACIGVLLPAMPGICLHSLQASQHLTPFTPCPLFPLSSEERGGFLI